MRNIFLGSFTFKFLLHIVSKKCKPVHTNINSVSESFSAVSLMLLFSTYDLQTNIFSKSHIVCILPCEVFAVMPPTNEPASYSACTLYDAIRCPCETQWCRMLCLMTLYAFCWFFSKMQGAASPKICTPQERIFSTFLLSCQAQLLLNRFFHTFCFDLKQKWWVIWVICGFEGWCTKPSQILCKLPSEASQLGWILCSYRPRNSRSWWLASFTFACDWLPRQFATNHGRLWRGWDVLMYWCCPYMIDFQHMCTFAAFADVLDTSWYQDELLSGQIEKFCVLAKCCASKCMEFWSPAKH